eukprot:TRINITY_DN10322_c0_g1_i3.p1 TRINITY_DN10322_c0_g1~~TRINITY_DN10322_c0_g1_i3.p1  ORF type:complete len:324 (+),score=39.58 TRINITY_DN10322_c0_g1_i3:101-1072(+)
MGQAASATSEALKSVKTTLGEERFSEVRQDAESLLAKPNPTETFSNKLHLSLDLTQTLIANISVKLLDKPSTEISLAIYAHLASVSSLGSRQDRMELVWMCMTAADERVGVEMLLPKLTQIVQSGYKQSGFQATEDDCALLVKACLTENELDCYKFQKLGSAHPSLQFVTDHVFASLRYTNVPLDAASVKLPQPSRLLTIPMLSVINASLPKHCRVGSSFSPLDCRSIGHGSLLYVCHPVCNWNHPTCVHACMQCRIDGSGSSPLPTTGNRLRPSWEPLPKLVHACLYWKTSPVTSLAALRANLGPFSRPFTVNMQAQADAHG